MFVFHANELPLWNSCAVQQQFRSRLQAEDRHFQENSVRGLAGILTDIDETAGWHGHTGLKFESLESKKLAAEMDGFVHWYGCCIIFVQIFFKNKNSQTIHGHYLNNQKNQVYVYIDM